MNMPWPDQPLDLISVMLRTLGVPRPAAEAIDFAFYVT